MCKLNICTLSELSWEIGKGSLQPLINVIRLQIMFCKNQCEFSEFCVDVHKRFGNYSW